MGTIDILKYAVEKAESRGYNSGFDLKLESGRLIDRKGYYAIIFDKEFCKSIWGEDIRFLPVEANCVFERLCALWEWHLKQMVVDINPIEYLKNNIDLDSWEKVVK